jgi:hypothetical protein
MDACMKELKKTNKLDVEDLTVENGLFKSFDEIVRRQLDPIWHTIGRKVRKVVWTWSFAISVSRWELICKFLSIDYGIVQVAFDERFK